MEDYQFLKTLVSIFPNKPVSFNIKNLFKDLDKKIFLKYSKFFFQEVGFFIFDKLFNINLKSLGKKLFSKIFLNILDLKFPVIFFERKIKSLFIIFSIDSNKI